MATYQVGVVGAGTMGAGIALTCAMYGHRVSIHDTNEVVLNKAKDYVSTILSKQAVKGKLSEQEKTKIHDSLFYVTDVKQLSECQIVIEAVPERMELKKTIFGALANICSPDALLCTNTSSLSITEIAGGLPNPARILGLHFFNPAPIMSLVEVVRGKKSGVAEIDKAYQFAKGLDKTPVLANDTPGFIVNRVARPYYNEALRILGDRTAEVEQIDRIMREAGGFKMGPFELQDMIGIDINFATTQFVYGGFFQDGRFKPSPIQQRMVQAGTLGRKTGEGFYDYE
jgi:3-hydroxybutyryl-CoA dehydrogenase